MTSDAPTLMVLAAGMGSRYGGLKQLDAMGPNGETVLDYSIYDAAKAGFEHIVFVIRRDIEEAFRETIGGRYQNTIQIEYAFQQLEDLPAPFTLPEGRLKPWGTAHAMRAARELITGPFAVINADDFYGAQAYSVLAAYFNNCQQKGKTPFCMVGYPLSHTLSSHGSVNRGVCQSRDGQLQSVNEITDIRCEGDGVIRGTSETESPVELEPDTLVSMNFWGFSPDIFEPLERHFKAFLKERGSELKSEFYIPSLVDVLINQAGATCDLLETSGDWFGVTYPNDKAAVQEQLKELIAAGIYPSPLNS